MSVMAQYQIKGQASLLSGVGALFFPYGSGKSWTVLSTIDELHRGKGIGRIGAIIFCKRRNVLSWQLEIAKRYPHYNVRTGITALSSPPLLSTIMLVPHHRVRCTYIRDWLAAVDTHRPAVVCVDESTAIKNSNTEIATTLHAVALHHQSAVSGGRRIIMSGNPTPEGPKEIWSQFQFVYGLNNPFGKTWYRFLQDWFIKADYSYALKNERRTEFYDLLHAWSLEFDDADWAEFTKLQTVNDRRYIIEHYEETPEQRRLLDKLYSEWSLPGGCEGDDEDDDEDRSHVEDEQYSYTMSIQMKAQQIASGFYYTKNGTVYLKSSPKIDLAVDVVSELISEGRSVAVWHRFKAEKDMLLNAIGKRCTILDGTVDSCIASFNKSTIPCAILMPYSANAGLNELTKASANVIVSNEYRGEARAQLEKRIDRLGQQSASVLHIDLCSPRQADVEVIAALQSKCLTPERLNTIVHKAKERK